MGILLRGGAAGVGGIGGGGCGDGMGNVSAVKLPEEATHAAHCIHMRMQERTAAAEGVGRWRETRGFNHRHLGSAREREAEPDGMFVTPDSLLYNFLSIQVLAFDLLILLIDKNATQTIDASIN